MSFDPYAGSVDVGLSSSATSFGTPIYSGGTVPDFWTLHDFTFVAPVSASYLTVQASTDLESWLHVDAFWLCDSQASATFRNAGMNPPSYTANPPVMGAMLNATVNLPMTGHAGGLLVCYLAPLNWTLPGGQVVLVDFTHPCGELLKQPPLFGGLVTWSMVVPLRPDLCGVTFHTQAIHFGVVRPVALSNAYDLTIGAF